MSASICSSWKLENSNYRGFELVFLNIKISNQRSAFHTFHLLTYGETSPFPLQERKNQEEKPEHVANTYLTSLWVFACVYLWQAEGDASCSHSVVGLDCKHKLVVGCGLHTHMSVERDWITIFILHYMFIVIAIVYSYCSSWSWRCL